MSYNFTLACEGKGPLFATIPGHLSDVLVFRDGSWEEYTGSIAIFTDDEASFVTEDVARAWTSGVMPE